MEDNANPFNAATYEQDIKTTVPYYEQFYLETIDLIRYLKPNALYPG